MNLTEAIMTKENQTQKKCIYIYIELFPFLEDQEHIILLYGYSRTIAAFGGNELLRKRQEETFQNEGTILIDMGVRGMYTFARAQQTAFLRWVYFIACKVYIYKKTNALFYTNDNQNV